MRFCLLFVLLAVSCRHRQGRIQPAGSPPYIPLALDTDASATVSPALPVSPILCMIQPGALYCQVTQPMRFRRGLVESPFGRGQVWHWSAPQGSGRGLVFFGCEDAQPACTAMPVFISSSVKVTASEDTRFVAGPDIHVPAGSLGIVDVQINANAFVSITDRWSGAYAPPLLKAGPGTAIACVADSCTVSVLPPAK